MPCHYFLIVLLSVHRDKYEHAACLAICTRDSPLYLLLSTLKFRPKGKGNKQSVHRKHSHVSDRIFLLFEGVYRVKQV
jgi:hypothetical protein